VEIWGGGGAHPEAMGDRNGFGISRFPEGQNKGERGTNLRKSSARKGRPRKRASSCQRADRRKDPGTKKEREKRLGGGKKKMQALRARRGPSYIGESKSRGEESCRQKRGGGSGPGLAGEFDLRRVKKLAATQPRTFVLPGRRQQRGGGGGKGSGERLSSTMGACKELLQRGARP